MTADFYKQFVSSGDLVFDIGANIGLKTEIFLSLGCRVIAVEPHPEALRVLHHLCPKAAILPDAVSREFGKRVPLITGLDTRISSLNPDWISAVRKSGRFADYDWKDAVTVHTITLDWMVAKYGVPRFIKIDVEGSEADVIRGLSSSIPALCFEFHSEFLDSTQECLQHLESLGSPTFQYSLGETLELSGCFNRGPIITELKNISKNSQIYGDIYVKF